MEITFSVYKVTAPSRGKTQWVNTDTRCGNFPASSSDIGTINGGPMSLNVDLDDRYVVEAIGSEFGLKELPVLTTVDDLINYVINQIGKGGELLDDSLSGRFYAPSTAERIRRILFSLCEPIVAVKIRDMSILNGTTDNFLPDGHCEFFSGSWGSFYAVIMMA